MNVISFLSILLLTITYLKCENNQRTLEFIIDLVNIYFTQHLSILVFLISYIHQYPICIVSTQTHRELQFVCLFVLLNSVMSLRVCILSWKILVIYFDPIRGVRPPNSVNKSTSTKGVDSVEKQRNFMSMTLSTLIFPIAVEMEMNRWDVLDIWTRNIFSLSGNNYWLSPLLILSFPYFIWQGQINKLPIYDAYPLRRTNKL